MSSWEDYIQDNIQEFRLRYGELFGNRNEDAEQDLFLSRILLNAPCQILVLNLFGTDEKYFIILHHKNFQDMKIEETSNMNYEDCIEELKKINLLENISKNSIIRIGRFMLFTRSKSSNLQIYWTVIEEGAIVYSRVDPRSLEPFYISNFIHELITYNDDKED